MHLTGDWAHLNAHRGRQTLGYLLLHPHQCVNIFPKIFFIISHQAVVLISLHHCEPCSSDCVSACVLPPEINCLCKGEWLSSIQLFHLSLTSLYKLCVVSQSSVQPTTIRCSGFLMWMYYQHYTTTEVQQPSQTTSGSSSAIPYIHPVNSCSAKVQNAVHIVYLLSILLSTKTSSLTEICAEGAHRKESKRSLVLSIYSLSLSLFYQTEVTDWPQA